MRATSQGAVAERPAGRCTGRPAPAPTERAAVVVLGDVGRSPRMQYHALALAERGVAVELVGAAGSEPLAALAAHPRVRLVRFDDPPPAHRGGLGLLAAAGARTARQAGTLWRALLRAAGPLDVVLAQNPPAVPTLAVALLAARRRRARLILDWHNLGYAMLALRLGGTHPLVRAAAAYERRLGRRADAHLCVSHAMRATLAGWGIDALVLHDRPAARFAPLPDAARESAVRALCTRLGVPASEPRPALIVTATSWGPDEDFGLLLDAVAAYEASPPADAPARLLIVASGRGPRRAAFEARAARLPERRVAVRTVWVAADEYPGLLAAADLGLCLHRPAAGLDPPMKVADMLGTGLPVLALECAAVRELLEPGESAVLFSSAAELTAALGHLFAGFPTASAALARLRAHAVGRAAGPRWHDGWAAHAAPLLLGAARPPTG